MILQTTEVFFRVITFDKITSIDKRIECFYLSLISQNFGSHAMKTTHNN